MDSKQQKVFDFTIIGAGIIGTLIARELSQYDVKTLLLEKENDIANVQTSANSAIIHSGHDPKPNTLKARLCVEGNKLYEDMEKTMHIPLRKTGALVVASSEEELKTLVKLQERAKINGVPSYELLLKEKVHELEPHLSDQIVGALSLPTTKVTFPWEVAIKACHVAIKNGVKFQKNSEVTQIKYVNQIFELTINENEKVYSKAVINASGVMAEHITTFLEEEAPFKVTPKRGEYFVVDRDVDGMFKNVIYPLPTDKGKGVLITPQTHGNLLLGPTSEYTDDPKVFTTSKGLTYVKEHVKTLCDHIPYHLIIRSFAGIRASINKDDFYIKPSKKYEQFYHVSGIDSPGLTAAPAIARYLVEEIIKLDAPLKSSFNGKLEKDIVFKDLSLKRQKALYEKKPLYGHIICQCEQVSEQEIIDAVHSEVGSQTIKGIKKRTRAGAGTCQGGYCQSEVLRIIARETNQAVTDINYDQLDTHILDKESKVGS
ncbi:FAD-dependent oxidoreductase [Mycoplasmatota bacterium]|nr:FAD-dependent oxidoreductase [Mycoplasmatota bacterium]